MKRFSPQSIIVFAIVLAIAGFLLLDASELPSRPSLVRIVAGRLVLANLPYRLVLLCSLGLLGIGLYRLWRQEKV
jgi:hypothetical protein